MTMPKLTEEQRKSIKDRLDRHERIRHAYDGKRYISQSCYLCNWASNGASLDEAIEANHQHISGHHAVEDREMRETAIPIKELTQSLHDHDCEHAICACICGCKNDAGCILVLGPLCSTCHLRAGRGDSAHGQ